MPVSLTKSTFYMVPKTGGVWVATALQRAVPNYTGWSPQHLTPGETFLHQNNALAKKAIKRPWFFFVRHPCEWYRSMWVHISTGRAIPQLWLYEGLANYRYMSFDEFVRKCVRHHPKMVTRLYESFCGGLRYGRCNVEHVGKQENLTNDLCRLLTALREPYSKNKILETPRENVSNPALKADAVYTDELWGMVVESEWVAFDVFDYETVRGAPAIPTASPP